ncbi:hypothetical protein VTI74DRAFT_1529 [Chaetomium olivicolor]
MTVDAQFAVSLGASLIAIYSYYIWMSRRMAAHAPIMPMGPEEVVPNPSTDGATAQDPRSSPFEPSISDVLVVKAMLNKALKLPREVVDTIVDLAEYWPHTSTEGTSDVMVRGSSAEEDRFLLRSAPLGLHRWGRPTRPANNTLDERIPPRPRVPGEEFPTEAFQELIDSRITMLEHPCRRIVFSIRSHDQGWGGEPGTRGTYDRSWTWFEVGLERWCKTSTGGTADGGQHTETYEKPSLELEDLCTILPDVELDAETGAPQFKHPLLPRENLKIQCNVTAKRETTEHCIVWSYTDDISPERNVEASAKLAESGRGTATGDGKFVRNLKLGDVVTVWAKARFAGWLNYVESIKMDVYYAI